MIKSRLFSKIWPIKFIKTWKFGNNIRHSLRPAYGVNAHQTQQKDRYLTWYCIIFYS